MTVNISHPLPQLHKLPSTMPLDNAIRLELEEGIPVFRAATSVQARIERLLSKQRQSQLSKNEHQELDLYEEIDDYLSFVNRTVRNVILAQANQDL